MATRPPAVCRECKNLTDGVSAYCADHEQVPIDKKREYEQERRDEPVAKMLKRLNNCARWRNGTRPIVLARDPICQDGRVCENKAFSEVVDHVIPARDYIEQHGGDENAYFDESNLRGSCKPCHDAKRDVGFGARR